ncbi:MAG: hypothetical protein E7004_02810 [Alphaproteobacteria bacterium]|nr:hypothetical protein [Alphaproteobacteria bacterium]
MSLFSLIFKYKDKKSPDKLGLYPESFHIPAFPERRYLWASRLLVVMAVMSMCVNIALTSIIYMLLPQITAKPSFLSADEASYKLDKTQPLHKNDTFMNLLTEGYIKDYITMRHAIPKSTTDLFYRWDKNSKFYWYSTPSAYYAFLDKLNQEQITRFIKQKMVRDIEIDYIKNIVGNLWIAQFKTYTSTINRPEPDAIIWRAYIRVRFDAFEKYEDLEKTDIEKENYTQNPFGFKVISYQLGYAGKPQKAYTAIETAKKVFESLEDVEQ